MNPDENLPSKEKMVPRRHGGATVCLCQTGGIPSCSFPRIADWFFVCDPEASGTDKSFCIM